MIPIDDIVIEPGRPDDAPAAARLIALTDPALFALLSAGDPNLWLDVSACEWRSDRGIYSHTMSHVARSTTGEVVGLLVGYSTARDARTDWTLESSRPHIDPARFTRLDALRPLWSYLFPEFPEDAYYVQNVVADPRLAGRGLGRRLMERAFTLGRAEGLRTCHLDVASDNPAVGFYQRLGLEVVVETLVPALARLGIPKHYRMTCSLELSVLN